MNQPLPYSPTVSTPAATGLKQYLTFTLGGEEFGIDILLVREVKGWVPTTRLPHSPSHLRGVLNLRGTILPVFDLRTRFGGGVTEASDTHVVIVLMLGTRLTGILVDSVCDIRSVHPGEIRPAPEYSGSLDTEFIEGLMTTQDHLIVLINIERMLLQDSKNAVLQEET